MSRPMPTPGFVHLHTHSDHSLLDGASTLTELAAAAAQDGQPALALTDHGTMSGAPGHAAACEAAGIRPIFGIEAYLDRAAADRCDQNGKQSGYAHITLLAETDAGYLNLVKLTSSAWCDTFHAKPLTPLATLAEFSEGVMATTGCLSGTVTQAILAGRHDTALEEAAHLKDIFDGRCYVELQDHGIKDQKTVNPHLLTIAKRLSLPLLATNDSHYTRRCDAAAHDALLCARTGARLSDTDRLRFDSAEEHYVKTAAEMWSVFREAPDACRNTLEAAERCQARLPRARHSLPAPPGLEGQDPDEALRQAALQGLAERWPGDGGAAAERLDVELRQIADSGTSAYFLIVADLVAEARRLGALIGPGRGSAAGSAVAYALRITDLDPIAEGLLFERFLNPNRRGLPDIDIDITREHRELVHDYATRIYGPDRVALLAAHVLLQPKAAIRDAGRVLDTPLRVVNQIAAAVPPPKFGRPPTLSECLDPPAADATAASTQIHGASAELRKLASGDTQIAKTLNLARGLEGRRRAASIHPAAMVISDRPISETAPLASVFHRGRRVPITQFEASEVEAAGLLKIDLLSLRNLDVIAGALRSAAEHSEVPAEPGGLPLDDAATFGLLAAADTAGVFQLESSGVRDLLRRIAPSHIRDVAATLALYRPGPMAAGLHHSYADRKAGRQSAAAFHPDADPLLSETYGLMVYQEDVMRIAQRFAGYTLADADDLRKAMSKKDAAMMARQSTKFIDGCVAAGYPSSLGRSIFADIRGFADYAFNKSHAAAYARIAYWTAYLKAHHPLDFYAALLDSCHGNQDKLSEVLSDLHAHGHRLLPPDVNARSLGFAPDAAAGGIRYSIGHIRDLSLNAAQHIAAAAAERGGFSTFDDFLAATANAVPARQAAALIEAGALDRLGATRRAMLETVTERHRLHRNESKHPADQMTLFDTAATRPPLPELPEFSQQQIARYEQLRLGAYVTAHPLDRLPAAGNGAIDADRLAEMAARGQAPAGGRLTVRGALTGWDRFHTSKGQPMAKFLLAGRSHTLNALIFPALFGRLGLADPPDSLPVEAVGRLTDDGGALAVSELRPLDAAGTVFEMSLAHADPDEHERLAASVSGLLGSHPGEMRVVIRTAADRLIRLPDSRRCCGSTRLGADAHATGFYWDWRDQAEIPAA